MDPYNIAIANIGSCSDWPTAHQAAVLGDLAGLERVVEDAETLLFDTDKNGFQPLHWAASKGHADVASFILQHHASAVALNSHSRNPRSPLHVAAYYGHAKVLELLLEGRADVSELDSRGATALHFAAEGGHGPLAQKLLAANAAISVRQDSQPLDRAVERGHADLVRLLIAARADFRSSGRKPPSQHIARAGHAEVISILLELSAATSQLDASPIEFDSVGAQRSRTAEL